uniref:Uncharacterized protein n=1 Tax=Plectus sambesii TaxID=2011161 RepID=A0A914WL36_9BILA
MAQTIFKLAFAFLLLPTCLGMVRMDLQEFLDKLTQEKKDTTTTASPKEVNNDFKTKSSLSDPMCFFTALVCNYHPALRSQR